MRLGELKNIIDDAIDKDSIDEDDASLDFQSEGLYGDAVYRVHEYNRLIIAIEELIKQSWVNADTDIVRELIKKYGKKRSSVELSPEEYNPLAKVVKNINQHLPIFYSALESFVQEQEEQVVNIKIPPKYLENFDELNKFNRELQEIFKLILLHKGLGGGIKIAGFDAGTSWYSVVITGAPLVYFGFMGATDIAINLIKLRAEWYKSEEVRLMYESRKKQSKEKSDEKSVIIEGMFEEKKQELLGDLIDKVGDSSQNSKRELAISLDKGLDKIIVLIEEGAKFHPSLTPPKYIKKGEGSSFALDYDKIPQQIEAQKKGETKQLTDQTSAKEEKKEEGAEQKN